MTPSLADLILMWMNENFPDVKWKIHGASLFDEHDWCFGAIGETVFGWVDFDEKKGLNKIHAADPEFFSKLKASIEATDSVRARLYEK